MADVHLPRPLVDLFPGAPRRLTVDAAIVLDVVLYLDRHWPGMRDRLCDPGPLLREHINIFVDGDKAHLRTPLAADAVVRIIPAVSDG